MNEQPRANLLEAMDALHQAHAALLAGDLRATVIKLALAEGILAEVRKALR